MKLERRADWLTWAARLVLLRSRLIFGASTEREDAEQGPRRTAEHLEDLLRMRAAATMRSRRLRLTMLYRSTDCRCCRGAPVMNVAHSASFHSCENNAPPNPGTKHLTHCGGGNGQASRTQACVGHGPGACQRFIPVAPDTRRS